MQYYARHNRDLDSQYNCLTNDISILFRFLMYPQTLLWWEADPTGGLVLPIYAFEQVRLYIIIPRSTVIIVVSSCPRKNAIHHRTGGFTWTKLTPVRHLRPAIRAVLRLRFQRGGSSLAMGGIFRVWIVSPPVVVRCSSYPDAVRDGSQPHPLQPPARHPLALVPAAPLQTSPNDAPGESPDGLDAPRRPPRGSPLESPGAACPR